MEGTPLDRHTLDYTNVLLPRPLHAMPVLPTVDRVAEHLKCGIVREQVDGVVDGLGAVSENAGARPDASFTATMEVIYRLPVLMVMQYH